MKSNAFLNFMKALIPFWNIIIFCYVWVLYYNEYLFSSFWMLGLSVSVILYALVYYAFGKLYHAFKIYSSRVSELMLSQFLAVGMSDLILYLMCYLMHMRFAGILPGLAAAAVQMTGTLTLLKLNKSCFAKYTPVQKTVIVYGAKKAHRKGNIETSVSELEQKLRTKHADLFDIQAVYPDTCRRSELMEKIKDFDTVILCHVSKKLRSEILAACTRNGKNVYITPKLEDIILTNCEYRCLIDTPLLMSGARCGEYQGKRIFDVSISLLMLILFSPIMLITALCIKLEDGGPVFYRQCRVTKNGREFDILKFRSMIVDAEKRK